MGIELPSLLLVVPGGRQGATAGAETAAAGEALSCPLPQPSTHSGCYPTGVSSLIIVFTANTGTLGEREAQRRSGWEELGAPPEGAGHLLPCRMGLSPQGASVHLQKKENPGGKPSSGRTGVQFLQFCPQKTFAVVPSRLPGPGPRRWPHGHQSPGSSQHIPATL